MWEAEERPFFPESVGYPHAAFDVRWPDTDTVEFDASRSFARRGRIVAYEWDFGDGTQARDVLHVISHRYERPGPYTVSLRVRDSAGLEATAQRVIVVSPEGEVGYEVLESPYNSRVSHQTVVVVRSFAELQRLWLEAFDNPPGDDGFPKIDFAREMVIALFLGARNTPSYSLRVEQLRVHQGRLEIQYTEIHEIAGPGCIVLPVVTHPYLWVKTPRVDLPYRLFFNNQTAYRVCR